jgi:superfamily II DNA or RNA helicase
MKIEMFKVPIMLDVIKDGLDNNLSIAIFVNYKETLFSLCHYLNTDCIIYGDQSIAERMNNIDKFQSNNSNIIICIIQAGDVGISLHDIHGNHQRMSVISPTWSGSIRKNT